MTRAEERIITTTDSAQALSEDLPLRMKDLIRLSGLQRQTIHYYIKEGLLPPVRKSATKSALYGNEHLERLLQISTLRNEQFLPIKAIRALYNDEAALALSEQQRSYLQGLKLGLPDSIRPGAEDYLPLVDATPDSVSDEDVQSMHSCGLINVVNSDNKALVSQEDASILQAWGELRALGFTSEKGYEPDLLKLWDSAMKDLVVREISFLAVGMRRDSQRESMEVTRATMAVIKGLIDVLHYKKTRAEFSKIYDSH